ncbi:MAG: hypothetical protein ACXVAE_04095 [Candidatus Limnocylindrales bacterium]
MPSLLLAACGLFLIGYGTWRSWTNGRRLLVPVVSAPDRRPPPAAGEAGGQPSTWSLVRHALWQLALALGWLFIAFLGLFMMTVAGEVAR